MNRARSAAIHAAGIALAFGTGWALKPERNSTPPILAPEPLRRNSPHAKPAGADHPRDKRAALSGREQWPEAAGRDLKEVRAAMTPGVVNQVLIGKLNAVLNIGENSIRVPRWQALVSAMRPEDAAAVREIFRENDREGRYWPDEFQAFWRQWGAIDGAAAAHSLVYTGRHPMQLQNLMAGWGRADAPAALEWVRKHRDGLDMKAALGGLVNGAGDQRAADAETLLLANQDDPLIRELYPQAAWKRVHQEGLSGAKPWFESLAAGTAPDNFKQASLQTLVGIMSQRTGNESAAALAAQYIREPWLPADAGGALGQQWAATDPVAGIAELGAITSPEARQAASSRLAKDWASRDAAGLSVWLTENSGHPSFDSMALGLVNEIRASDPEAAKAWAARIQDTSLHDAGRTPAEGLKRPGASPELRRSR